MSQDEDALPIMEEVLASQEPASSEVPILDKSERDVHSQEISHAEKKVEISLTPRHLCSPEERRQIQRNKLNQILLNLLEKIPGKNGELTVFSQSGLGGDPHFGDVCDTSCVSNSYRRYLPARGGSRQEIEEAHTDNSRKQLQEMTT